MFCIHCGKEIENDSKFCPFCGGQQPEAAGPQTDTAAGDAATGSAQPEGSTDPGAVTGNESFSQSSSQDSGQQIPPENKKSWKEYLTPENMELAAVLVLMLPVFTAVVSLALHVITTLLGNVPVIGTVFGIVSVIVSIIFVIAAGIGLTSCIYIIATDQNKRSTWSYITLGGAVIAFLSCLGIMFPAVRPVALIIGIISLFWGLDAVSRVALQKKGIESAANVGEDLGAYSKWYADYKAEHPSSAENEAQRIANDPQASYFDGSGLSLLGLTLLTVIVSAITCGIAAPWMICKLYSWRKEHTVINGRRLRFTGTGGSLLGHWILWEILCVITCGIYSFFMHVALKKWEMEHTEYADQPNVLGQFDGDSFEYFGYGLLQAILLLLTCGLAAPWTITMIQKWEMRHSVVAGDRMTYEGTALGILGQYIIIFLLSAITCGIYSPWGTVRLNKYIYSHTRVYK